ncbi:MAG: anhydro-N-acetylmuramic acid kinase [Candidatus Pseudobacter hemicellulosilyticus]|uniref:Anhydro-N-acetylmuramic acid kinase n=1 Tax=Candidatus Pseudobacter hemicellulosilyticus TaxID=3121375 RepID=A0AAJ5WVA3_9BACT|nr:MAG: anhydro-N-acetylmuramic acid kinase [Pseudobacter sp.]
MVYRTIGLMSGSALDGLDIVFVELHENARRWQYEILASATYPYPEEWVEKLRTATSLNALDYQLLHTDYGHYIGQQVNEFINRHGLQYKVQLIASHGHTSFHMPSRRMTAQLGDGAAIAAETGINVVSDLRAMDVALGGQGAPIVPVGEKLLLGEYDLFLNIGGIANLSYNHPGQYSAFDVCPGNRVLNMLAAKRQLHFDEGGALAAAGSLQPDLLEMLNDLEYYRLPAPKSLANDFGVHVVFPLLMGTSYSLEDKLRTYVEHIALQVRRSAEAVLAEKPAAGEARLLITGGGAHNTFLVERLRSQLQEIGVEVVVPDELLVDFKEAIVMALIGVLRWREEKNVFSSVTGSQRDSIGGAVWVGQD